MDVASRELAIATYTASGTFASLQTMNFTINSKHTLCTTAFISTPSLISADTTSVSPSIVAFTSLSHSSYSNCK